MIHFVYAVPRSRQGLLKRLEPYEWQVLRRVPKFVPTWRRGLISLGSEVLRAPGSITVNLYRFLAARHPTHLYDLTERTTIDYGRDDVVLGHPWFEPGTVIENVMRDPRPCRLKALIFPISHGLPPGQSPEDNLYAAPMVDRADLVFGIMGPYWYDTLDTSRFANWQPKIVRVDMALDTRHYPRIKTSFNPPGRRGFLYIGSNRRPKGPDVLARTMAELTEFRRGWIGYGDEIPNMPRLSTGAELTPDFMAAHARDYDLFVNTSISDANPTTILEAMAWGFPVACTPQSGYYRMPTIVELSTIDIDRNVRVLRELQYAPEERLRGLADENRRMVERDYTWQRFCATVWDHLKPALPESTPGARAASAGGVR